jgi:hypothetical protein
VHRPSGALSLHAWEASVLLHDVRELVRDQLSTCSASRVMGAPRKEDMLTKRECTRLQGRAQQIRPLILVYSHLAEIAPETWLKKPACRIVDWLTTAVVDIDLLEQPLHTGWCGVG